MCLSLPIDITEIDNIDDLFEQAYDVFSEEWIDRGMRPRLLNVEIRINENQTHDEKIGSFWHVASIGENDTKFDMDPCINDIASGKCKYECNSNHPENFLKDEHSIPCIFRAQRIKWIGEIIDIVNNNRDHNGIKCWKVKDKKGDVHFKIRYTNKPIDYVLIFKCSYKKNIMQCYRLITAYPVVLKSYRDRFNREYNTYVARKK